MHKVPAVVYDHVKSEIFTVYALDFVYKAVLHPRLVALVAIEYLLLLLIIEFTLIFSSYLHSSVHEPLFDVEPKNVTSTAQSIHATAYYPYVPPSPISRKLKAFLFL